MSANKLVPMMLLAAAGAMACGSMAPVPAGASSGPPPEPGRDLRVWLQELDTRAGHVAWARNDSDRIHRVTAITLRDCTNIRESCETHRVDVVLCPGEASRVFAVHPRVPESRTFFRWDYRARSYEPGEPVIGADCGDGAYP